MQPIKHFYNGPGETPSLDLVLRNDLADLGRLHRGVEDFAATHKLPSSIAHAVDLSLTELVTNIISYAYEDTRSHEVLVRLQCDSGLVQIRVEDDGRPFDPIKHPVPDTAAITEHAAPIIIPRRSPDGMEKPMRMNNDRPERGKSYLFTPILSNRLS